MAFECKVSGEFLEKALRTACKEESFMPLSYENLNLFLIKSFKNLEEEIFLLNPEILENFTLIQETKMGSLKLSTLSEKLQAIEIGSLSIKDLKEEIVKGIIAESDVNPILKDEEIIFVSNETEIVNTFKPSLNRIKLLEFITLRQEFFTRLKEFNLTDENFIKKILKLVEPEISVKNFLKLFENRLGNFNLVTFYPVLFFIIEGVGLIKKK